MTSGDSPEVDTRLPHTGATSTLCSLQTRPNLIVSGGFSSFWDPTGSNCQHPAELPPRSRDATTRNFLLKKVPGEGCLAASQSPPRTRASSEPLVSHWGLRSHMHSTAHDTCTHTHTRHKHAHLHTQHEPTRTTREHVYTQQAHTHSTHASAPTPYVFPSLAWQEMRTATGSRGGLLPDALPLTGLSSAPRRSWGQPGARPGLWSGSDKAE